MKITKTPNANSKLQKEIDETNKWLLENTRGNEIEFTKKARHRNDLLCKLNLEKPRQVVNTVMDEYILPKK